MSKPILAEDYVESKLVFPLIAEPKIDGVRAHNPFGELMARSMKPIRNKFTRTMFSHSQLVGFDGELAAQHECHPDLCRLTTSATSTIEGSPFTLWWLFDYCQVGMESIPYHERLKMLREKVDSLQREHGPDSFSGRLRVVEAVTVYDLAQLNSLDTLWLEKGYEGTIIRSINGQYKRGRSTVREGLLLRIKRFIEEDARVIGIIEGQENANEAQTNELGYQFRTTHKENMVPNGKVGTLVCELLKDVKVDGKVLFTKGQQIDVSPGAMPHNDREYYWLNQNKILGKIIKFKFFPKGIKDKPRFPTFHSFRDETDL